MNPNAKSFVPVQVYYPQAYRLAGAGNRIELTAILTRYPYLLDMPDQYGNVPLHAAARRGQIKIVHQLLQHGSQAIDTPNKAGQTPLWMAIRHARSSMVRELVRLGASKMPPKKWGSYFHAATLGNTRDGSMIDLLQELQFPGWNKIDSNGYTPLHLAVMSFNFRGMEKMQKWGNIDWRASSISAMDALLQFGNRDYCLDFKPMKEGRVSSCQDIEPDLLRMFRQLDRMGSPEFRTFFSQCWFFRAAFRMRNGIIIPYLKSIGFNTFDAAISDSKYPICLAAREGEIRIVERLIQAGSQKIDPALTIAFQQKDFEMIQLLLAVGAWVDRGWVYHRVLNSSIVRSDPIHSTQITHQEIVREYLSPKKEHRIRTRLFFSQSLVYRLICNIY